jgi:hypothetical protein
MTEDAHCPRGSLTIEHIMPQSWRRYWNKEVTSEEQATQRDHLIDQLGNLTLLTNRLNPVASNYPWQPTTLDGKLIEGKRKVVEQHSVLFLNKRVLDNYRDEWNNRTIQERTHSLAEQVTRIWMRG